MFCPALSPIQEWKTILRVRNPTLRLCCGARPLNDHSKSKEDRTIVSCIFPAYVVIVFVQR